jgi:ABC-2 type transport system ATP-binding protein
MLTLQHVAKSFGKVDAVRDVSFEIATGSTFGLLGPNGAGKTTTMRMILGILTPDVGTIRWNERAVDAGMRKRCGYLPEERGLYGKMKVRDQISFFGRLHGLVEPEISKRTAMWIERLGIAQYANRPCAELSKGNQQKVQVACAAVHEPELLILDEPFSGLDPVNADILLAILNDMKAKGTTLVLSSHQMWQLEVLCDRFCIITNGANRMQGTLADLRATLPTRVLRVAPDGDAVRATLDRIAGARAIGAADGNVDYEIPVATPLPDLLRALVADGPIAQFQAIEPSLHDIYVRTIGDAA